MAKDILLGDKEFMYEETETGFTFARRLDENMRQGVFLKSPLSDHDSFIMGLREYFKDHKNINLSDIQIAYEKMPREDVWIMNDKQYSSEPEQKLKTHKEEIMATNTKGFFDGTYKNNDGSTEYVKGNKVTTVDYGQSSTIEYTDEELKKYFGNKKKTEEDREIIKELSQSWEKLNRESPVERKRLTGYFQGVDTSADMLDTYDVAAKNLVKSAMKHSDQKHDVKISNITIAKKAGYVQGVCESLLALNSVQGRRIISKPEIDRLSKILLSEMHVTKEMAKKYAHPETYKALEQGIFAPQQKLEQTHSIKR